MRSSIVSVLGTAALALFLFLLTPLPGAGQPFGSWTLWERPSAGFIRIPHSPALNPVGQITLEGWVAVSDGGGCSAIVSKGFVTGWSVAICGTQLRSYLKGVASARTAGVLDSGPWNHFAVTFDGVERCHYINGELIQCWNEPGPLATNTLPVRIGSDPELPPNSPVGAINELRLWNVARTLQQIRSTINRPLSSPQPGLVAVWSGGGPTDAVGPHDGTIVGDVPALTFPVTNFPCSNTATSLCLQNHFVATVKWRTGGPSSTNTGNGMLTPLVSPQSGVFWFFSPANWELMVKVLAGCPVNNHWWVFTAATTNVFYRLEVLDIRAGVNKVYFNYPGPPAPAVTDTAAFATCP